MEIKNITGSSISDIELKNLTSDEKVNFTQFMEKYF